MAIPTGTKNAAVLGKAGAPITLADSSIAYAGLVILVDATGTPIPAGSAADPNVVVGNVASGAADSGAPVKVGGLFTSGNPSALSTGQRSNLNVSQYGELKTYIYGSANNRSDGVALNNIVSVQHSGFSTENTTIRLLANAPYGFNGSTHDQMRGDTNGAAVQPALSSAFWRYAGVAGGITDAADVTLAAAGGASVRNYLASIQYHNTSATASEIVIKDGSTVIWRGYAPASMTVPATVAFEVPLKGTANTALNVAMITTGTATRVSAQGYQGA